MRYNEFTQTNDEPEYSDFIAEFMQGINPGNIKQVHEAEEKIKDKYFAAWANWTVRHNIPQSVLDEWSAQAIANKPQNVQKDFWDKMRAKYQQIVDKVGDVLDRGAQAAMVALFLPLKPVAEMYLRSAGISPESDTKKLIKQVLDEARKRGQIPQAYGLDENDVADLITPDTIQIVIGFLKSIFDMIKRKNDAGQPLTPEEQQIAGDVQNIAEQMQQAPGKAEEELNKADEKADQIASSEPTKNWMQIAVVILVLIVLLYFLFR